MFTFFHAMLRLYEDAPDAEWRQLKPIVACRLINLSPTWSRPEHEMGLCVESITGPVGARTAYVRVKQLRQRGFVRYRVSEATDEVSA